MKPVQLSCALQLERELEASGVVRGWSTSLEAPEEEHIENSCGKGLFLKEADAKQAVQVILHEMDRSD